MRTRGEYWTLAEAALRAPARITPITGASDRDKPGTYDAAYRAVAVDGDVAMATGSSTDLSSPGGPVDEVYDNCFVMRFDAAGRCREFTEWYVRRPRLSPLPRPARSYCMDAATMQLQRHGSGIHVVRCWYGRCQSH
jgi:hypothetical protein